MRTRSDTARVLTEVARLVQEARAHVAEYAGERAPLRSDQVAELLRRSHCYLSLQELDGVALGMVLPAVAGMHALVVERHTPRADRRFLTRHELSHVLRGDVGEEPVYVTDGDTASHAERVADTFALADLIPGSMIRALRDAGLTWQVILDDLVTECREFASLNWSDERARDRAELRLLLLKDYGL